MEHPCNDDDMDLFYVSTTITIGCGHTAKFWHTPWLNGRKPKVMAHYIFSIAYAKNSTIWTALTNEAWVTKIDTSVVA